VPETGGLGTDILNLKLKTSSHYVSAPADLAASVDVDKELMSTVRLS